MGDDASGYFFEISLTQASVARHDAARDGARSNPQQATLLAKLLGDADASLLLRRIPHVVKCTPNSLRTAWSTLRRIADDDERNALAFLRKCPELLTVEGRLIQVSWYSLRRSAAHSLLMPRARSRQAELQMRLGSRERMIDGGAAMRPLQASHAALASCLLQPHTVLPTLLRCPKLLGIKAGVLSAALPVLREVLGHQWAVEAIVRNPMLTTTPVYVLSTKLPVLVELLGAERAMDAVTQAGFLLRKDTATLQQGWATLVGTLGSEDDAMAAVRQDSTTLLLTDDSVARVSALINLIS